MRYLHPVDLCEARGGREAQEQRVTWWCELKLAVAQFTHGSLIIKCSYSKLIVNDT